MLISSPEFKCSNEILTIAMMLVPYIKVIVVNGTNKLLF